MNVRVLLFASYRDLAGKGELTITVPYGARAQDVVTALRTETPALPPEPVIAINREYSSLDEVLSEGDELALLPPVAGG